MEPEAEIIRAQLFALQDEAYRTFPSALMPTVPPETVIGVRVPALRKLAKQLACTAHAEVFLQALPHGYYEENNLDAFLTELMRRWLKRKRSCPTSTTGPPVTAFAPKCLQSTRRSCWCPFAAGWIRVIHTPCAMAWRC